MSVGKRLLITGGSGKAGKHVAKFLLHRGHRVLNCDLVNYAQDGLDYLKLDITKSGEVFNALSCHFNKDELRNNQKVLGLDALIHFLMSLGIFKHFWMIFEMFSTFQFFLTI